MDQTARQMLVLFLGSFAILFAGMGLFPLLPVYLARFGASPTFIGVFYSLIYAANSLGPLSTGRLTRRISHRSLFILGGLLGIPTLALLGRAAAAWQVVALSMLIWFLGGMNLALVSIYAGACSSRARRGRVFSLMTLAIPLGTLIGAFALGQAVARSGFEAAFLLTAGVWAALPLIGVYGLKGMDLGPPPRPPAGGAPRAAALGPGFRLLAGLTLASLTAVNMGRLGVTLQMQAGGFGAGQIAGAAVFSGLASIPTTLISGAWSDRLGRRRFLLAAYLAAAAGALILGFAGRLWGFWLASGLLLASYTANRAMASAAASEILPRPALTGGLALMNAVSSLAGILSFTLAGFLVERFDPGLVFTAVAAVPALAALGLGRVVPPQPLPEPGASQARSREAAVQVELIKKCM